MNRTHWNIVVLLLLGIVTSALLLPEAAFAQIDAGGVAGTVRDSAGAVVGGVRITLTEDVSNLKSTTQSNQSGAYAFNGVKPGGYTVTASSPGFQTFVAAGVMVHVQQTSTLDIGLQLGNVQQQVSVTAAAPLLQAEDASLGQTIGSQAINDLPLNGRNWGSLGQLVAGVATTPGSNPGSAFYSVNGVQMYQNDFRLNGINNNIEFFGGSSVGTDATITPPPDAIQEFRLQSGDYSAEFGHSTGGVVNAVVRSGSNQLHGNLWEYIRNEAFNANGYFSKHGAVITPRAEYRQNQFGGTIGGPVLIPKLYDGRNRTFFFFDYQGTRILSPSQASGTVPTASMVSSGFTNLQDMITYNSGTTTDGLGRKFAHGTILDPATTRQVAAGQMDPITGLQNRSSSAIYVRDPFYAGGSLGGITDFTGRASLLNRIPAGRLDPNALKLLAMYPAPLFSGQLQNNFRSNERATQTQNTYDIRIDETFGEKDTLFGVFDESHFTQLAPGGLPGQNDQNNSFPAYAIAVGYNHVFTPTWSNELHIGFGHSVKDQILSNASVSGLPEQYGIGGIPQVPGNGGMSSISIGGLTSLGPTDDRPTIGSSWDLEAVDNVTKTLHNHTFKMGVQWDWLGGNRTQPAAPRGAFTFSGQFSDVPNSNAKLNGIADMLLTPAKSNVGGVDNVGGLTTFLGSNFNATQYRRYYTGLYFQDNWRITPALTLNLGLRWDYFTPYQEANGRQANFIPSGNGNGSPGTYYMPKQGCDVARNSAFDALLAASNITLDCVSDKTLGHAQVSNFAPRVGFAYRVFPTLVVRGGYGISYGALGNLGTQGTLGTNYPFIYSITQTAPNSQAPLLLSNGETATLENTFTTINLSNPAFVNPKGLSLFGRQWDYRTPYVQTYNLTVQDQFTKHDAIQIGYVGTLGRHLDNILIGSNSPSEILPPGTNVSQIPSQSNNFQSFIPFPNFAPNSTYETTNAASSYNSMQMTYQHELSNGLSLLANYTYSKCFSNQRTQGTGSSAYRAPWLPGFGISRDYGLCDTDTTNTIHVSGGYALPIGRGKTFLHGMSRLADTFFGGWAANGIYTYQTGNPLTVSCATATTSGFGCFAPVVQGQDLYSGPHNVSQWLNPHAFGQPAAATQIGQTDYSVLGGNPQQARGPNWYNVDSSVFKQFQITEGLRLQFRAEAFNTFNHAQFSQPGSLNYSNPSNFAVITSTRNGPRLLQFALKVAF